MKKNSVYNVIFPLCWASYFIAYLGRLNYGAVIAEMVVAEGFSNSACGLVSTGFFICYGGGQLISGVLGDRIGAKQMVFMGLAVSGLCNLAMAFMPGPGYMLWVWCFNGLAQSMTWAPILRAFSQYLPPEPRKRACVNIATTYPLGTLAVFGLSGLVIMLAGWRQVFFITWAIMTLMSVVWFVVFSYMERSYPTVTDTAPVESGVQPAPTAPVPLGRSVLVMLAVIGCALAMQGALRDGIMTWIPTYLNSTFGVGTTFSIFATMVLPIVNLSGAYISNFLLLRLNKNELQASMLLFVAGGGAAVLLALFGRGSLVVSVAAFAVITSCMTGTNVLMVHIIPTYFVRYGRVSTVSGAVNATVYIGSSLATFGIGAIADTFGWGALLAALCLVAGAGAVFCIIAAPGWQRFIRQ